MKTKHFFLVALAMIFALPAVLVSCGDDEDSVPSTAYSYFVEYRSADSYPSFLKADAEEPNTILNDLKSAIGYKQGSMKVYYSMEDDNMKNSCQNVINKWNGKVNGSLLTYALVRRTSGTDGKYSDQDVAKFEVGRALQGGDYVLYSFVTNEQEAWANYNTISSTLSKEAGAVTRSALKAIVGQGNHSATSSSLSISGTPSYFEQYFGVVFDRSLWLNQESTDNLMKEKCDSIADRIQTHLIDNKPNLLAVDAKVSVVKMGFRSNLKETIWTREFPATYVPED